MFKKMVGVQLAAQQMAYANANDRGLQRHRDSFFNVIKHKFVVPAFGVQMGPPNYGIEFSISSSVTTTTSTTTTSSSSTSTTTLTQFRVSVPADTGIAQQSTSPSTTSSTTTGVVTSSTTSTSTTTTTLLAGTPTAEVVKITQQINIKGTMPDDCRTLAAFTVVVNIFDLHPVCAEIVRILSSGTCKAVKETARSSLVVCEGPGANFEARVAGVEEVLHEVVPTGLRRELTAFSWGTAGELRGVFRPRGEGNLQAHR